MRGGDRSKFGEMIKCANRLDFDLRPDKQSVIRGLPQILKRYKIRLRVVRPSE